MKRRAYLNSWKYDQPVRETNGKSRAALIIDVRRAAYDVGASQPYLSFRRWRARECLRIDMGGGSFYYDGHLAWHAIDECQGSKLAELFNPPGNLSEESSAPQVARDTLTQQVLHPNQLSPRAADQNHGDPRPNAPLRASDW